MKAVPKSLKTWYNVHIIADLIFGIPFLFFPMQFLNAFGWAISEAFPWRIFGAALVGIAVLSYVVNKSNDIQAFRNSLKFKSVWGGLCFFVSIYTALTTGPAAVWFGVAVFFVFGAVWNYYRAKV